MPGLVLGLTGLVSMAGFQLSERLNRELGLAGPQFIAVCFIVSVLAAGAFVSGLIRRSPRQLVLLYLVICILAAAAGAWGLRVRWSPEI
jgi:hypothetical protein